MRDLDRFYFISPFERSRPILFYLSFWEVSTDFILSLLLRDLDRFYLTFWDSRKFWERWGVSFCLFEELSIKCDVYLICILSVQLNCWLFDLSYIFLVPSYIGKWKSPFVSFEERSMNSLLSPNCYLSVCLNCLSQLFVTWFVFYLPCIHVAKEGNGNLLLFRLRSAFHQRNVSCLFCLISFLYTCSYAEGNGRLLLFCLRSFPSTRICLLLILTVGLFSAIL